VIQIIGTKKSKETSKAIRFFKERGTPFQFKDLKVKELSLGELKKIASVIAVEDLLDKESQTYKKKGMQYMDFDIAEEILEDNSLLRLPIVRNQNLVTVGLDETVWKKWVLNV